MFYVMNEDTLSIFDDSKEKIETTREFMPQLAGQLTLETDIVTAEELEAHPNKVIVGDVPVEIDVPDYEQATDEEGNPIYDEEGNPVMIPVMIDKEETIIVIDYDEEGNPIGEHEETIIVQVPSTHKETIYVKGIVLNPDYEQEEAEKEAERIGNLQITKRVFMLGLQQLGVTYSQLKQLIATNEQAQMEWDLCVELQRKNPLLDIMAAQLSVSPAMLDYIFQKANGEDVQPPVIKE